MSQWLLSLVLLAPSLEMNVLNPKESNFTVTFKGVLLCEKILLNVPTIWHSSLLPLSLLHSTCILWTLKSESLSRSGKFLLMAPNSILRIFFSLRPMMGYLSWNPESPCAHLGLFSTVSSSVISYAYMWSEMTPKFIGKRNPTWQI